MALALGYANPDAMLAEMPHRVYLEWQEFYTDEPFGEWRDDARMAILAAVIANSHKGKKGRSVKPRQFMNYIRKRRSTKPLTDEQRARRSLRMAQMFGWEVKRVGDPIEIS